MDWLVSLWSDSNSVGHILLVYAIVITVGLLLGRIKIFGISLGVTFVLFAGLAAGYFGFTVNTTVLHFLRDFGLILFVFFIGLQVGPSFFSSFRSGGVQLNLLTLLAVFLSLAVTVGLYFAFSDTVSLPQMLGVYFGAVTNTPGLGATQEALNMLDYKGEDIAVAYAAPIRSPLWPSSQRLSACALSSVLISRKKTACGKNRKKKTTKPLSSSTSKSQMRL